MIKQIRILDKSNELIACGIVIAKVIGRRKPSRPISANFHSFVEMRMKGQVRV